MKAVAIDQYGGPEVLHIAELEDPKLGPDSILVRVKAAGVNPVDYKIRYGYLDQAFPSYFPLILGWDVSGVIEAVGATVKGFKKGDEVFAYARKDFIGQGCYAELVSIPIRSVAKKPQTIDHNHCAGIPLAGLTAYQAIVETLKVSKGQTILIHAATGGVGSFAVQIAKTLGAEVIGTARKQNHNYLQQLGATMCIDYTETSISDQLREKFPQGVDAVFDLVGGQTLQQSPALLKSSSKTKLASVVDPKVKTLGGDYVFVRPNSEQLQILADMTDAGDLKVELSEVFPLEQTQKAHELLELGHVRGKLTLEIG